MRKVFFLTIIAIFTLFGIYACSKILPTAPEPETILAEPIPDLTPE